MLNRATRILSQTFAIEKKLFVYDSGNRDKQSESGINACVFGATGFLGRSVTATLGGIGSSLMMPISSFNERYWEHPKQLKLAGNTNRTWVQWESDLRDDRFIQNMIRNNNVVINLLGPRQKLKKREDFQFINIEVPERIAKICAKQGVHRLIHFSAAAANPNSPSLDFQTKFEGERVVKAAFPNATIFRPCAVYGQNDHFAHIILRQATFFFNKLVTVYDDCTTKKQPIFDADVALAVLNALKLEETKGRTYELGGPHVLTMLEIHQIIFNMLNFKPALAYVNPDLALAVASKLYNWDFFGVQVIKKKTIEEVVSGNVGTIQDLHVEPVAFKNGIFKTMRQFIFRPITKNEDYEN